MERMCKKSISEKLFIKLTKECTFAMNNQLIKQKGVSPIGGPVSVTYYMCRMEDDVIAPIKMIFYKRYPDYTYVKIKNTKYQLFENHNTYNSNIKLTIEVSPKKFSVCRVEKNSNYMKNLNPG